MMTFKDISEIAASYPGTVESTSYGTPAIKLGKKLLLRLHQKEDAIVMMLASVEEQQALIENDPMTFFITDHYAGYPAVLVRPTVDPATFERLLSRAWRRSATKTQLARFND